MLPINIPSMSMGSSVGPNGSDSSGYSFGGGSWVINLAGSGKAYQSGSASMPWLMIAVAAGAAWFLLKK